MANVKNNLRAAALPQATDDETQGYEVGSLWFAGAVMLRCSDATEDAAVWEVVPAGFRRLASGKSASHTGGTTETTIATISVPPVGAHGAIRITVIPKFTGTAGTKTVRLKWDGTSLMFAQSTAANISGYFQRTLFADGTETAQFSESNLALGPFSFSGSAIQTFAEDWSSPVALTITGQLANGADSIDWVYYLVEHMYAT